jgi:hypothetical protein
LLCHEKEAAEEKAQPQAEASKEKGFHNARV